jgi:tripartite-type tricarboxylate transporter receptor subunit TctC
MPIDPVRELEPVSLTFRSPHVLVVRAGLPVNSVQELIALAQRQPGKLTYGHAGVGSMTHLAAVLFTTKTSTDILGVAYRGGGLAMNDLLAGTVDMLFDGFPSAVPNIQDGRVRALAMCGTERAALFPDVPTMQQAGVTGYNAGTWQAVFGPRGMPRSAIDRLVAVTREAAASAPYRERVARAGAEATATSPEELAQVLQQETDTWAEVIRAANITAT